MDVIPFIIIALAALVFCFILFAFITAIINGVRTAARNQAAPLLDREARVVSKRQHIWGGGGRSSAHTSYYITFEFADGTREEFDVRGSEYGLLAEGDRGTLRSKGSSFKGFWRNSSPY